MITCVCCLALCICQAWCDGKLPFRSPIACLLFARLAALLVVAWHDTVRQSGWVTAQLPGWQPACFVMAQLPIWQ